MFRILTVDDTKSVHTFVGEILRKVSDVELTKAVNGKSALEILEADSSYDILFLDWEMPILDGPSTLKEIKRLGYQCPVIMMTTKNSLDDVKHILSLGAVEYMMKPFDVEIFFDKIYFATGKRFFYGA